MAKSYILFEIDGGGDRDFSVLSNEPAFAVRIVRGKTPHEVTYLDNGKFETAVDTVTTLKSKNKHTVEYRLIRGNQWQLTFGEQYCMNPTLPEIDALIQQ